MKTGTNRPDYLAEKHLLSLSWISAHFPFVFIPGFTTAGLLLAGALAQAGKT